MIETRELTKIYGEVYALERRPSIFFYGGERENVYGFIGQTAPSKTTNQAILATPAKPLLGRGHGLRTFDRIESLINKNG